MKNRVKMMVCVSLFILPCLAFGQWDEKYDLDGDGVIGLGDFAMLAAHWLETSPPPEPDITWVTIGNSGFVGEMSVYETTNAQYCQYLNSAMNDGLIVVAGDVVYAASDTGRNQPYFAIYPRYDACQCIYSDGVFTARTRDGHSMDDHPVVFVTLYGASAFCAYYGWRLPTDAEWLAAGSYGNAYLYGTGTTIDTSRANYNNVNPLGLTSRPYTTPVGYYGTYGYGLADISGNVWEWTSSLGSGYPILRGGAFYAGDAYGVSFVYYSLNYADVANDSQGFRVCR